MKLWCLSETASDTGQDRHHGTTDGETILCGLEHNELMGLGMTPDEKIQFPLKDEWIGKPYECAACLRAFNNL